LRCVPLLLLLVSDDLVESKEKCSDRIYAEKKLDCFIDCRAILGSSDVITQQRS
jgi:hypothetical protein